MMWLMVEIAIIASDIQEVVGTATAMKILFGIPEWIGALVTIVNSFLFLFIHYFGIRKLELFFIALIFTMAVCFWINMIKSKPDYGELFLGLLIPRIPGGSLDAWMGLVGAIIMPHNLYLHSSLVLSRGVDIRKRN